MKIILLAQTKTNKGILNLLFILFMNIVPDATLSNDSLTIAADSRPTAAKLSPFQQSLFSIPQVKVSESKCPALAYSGQRLFFVIGHSTTDIAPI
ncbi:hypothetical protein CIK78_05190 [Halomonas sp. JB37]|nr:hypothetical protein CIK78_05190 [Halomonas sp. JB37]